MTQEREVAPGRVSRTGRPRVWRLAREPAVLVLLAVGLVHVIRRDVADIVIFFGAVVAIVLDARADRPARRPHLASGLSTRQILVVCAGYALMVLPLSRSGWPMRLLLVVPGLVALLVVIRAGRSPLLDEPPGRPLGRGRLAWPAVAVAMCVFELANFSSQVDPTTGNPQHPTISAIVEPLLAGSLPRAVFAGVWLAAGVWLVRAITTGTGGDVAAMSKEAP